MHNPRILIGTLFVDENELESCRKALSDQTCTNWHHHVFSGLANREAHRQLYKYFMDNRKEYDIFIKLDADMVLRSSESLAQIAREFEKESELDHAVFLVHDWMSSFPIIGLHAFSNRVCWESSDERLFVDPDPARPGQKKVFESYPSPIADHSPDPSPFQAFRFGVHRASKILQPFKWWVDSAQADFQWELLNRIRKTYQQEGDRRRLLALLGAQWLWSGKSSAKLSSYTDASVREAFGDIEQLSDDRLADILSPAWQSTAGRFWMRYRRTVFRSAISSIGRVGVRAVRVFRQSGS